MSKLFIVLFSTLILLKKSLEFITCEVLIVLSRCKLFCGWHY